MAACASMLVALLGLAAAELFFADTGGLYRHEGNATSLEMLEEMVRGGYRSSNLRLPSKVVVMTLSTDSELEAPPAGYFRVAGDAAMDGQPLVLNVKADRVYTVPEYTGTLASCGKTCFVEVFLEKPLPVMESLLRYRDALVVVNHVVADTAAVRAQHRPDAGRRAAAGALARGDAEGASPQAPALGKYASPLDDPACYPTNWRAYHLPKTNDPVNISNHQALFWGCFIVALAFIIVPLWMWFMNTTDPEDVGSMMAMDNNLSPLIEEERWERE